MQLLRHVHVHVHKLAWGRYCMSMTAWGQVAWPSPDPDEDRRGKGGVGAKGLECTTHLPANWRSKWLVAAALPPPPQAVLWFVRTGKGRRR